MSILDRSRMASTQKNLFIYLVTILAYFIVSGPHANSRSLSPTEIKNAGDGCHFIEHENAKSKRFAFVIGVAEYSRKDLKLKNPAADSRAVAVTLNSLGFDVALSINSTRKALLDCASQARKLQARQARELSIFYYSGHGVQIDDLNFLVAADLDKTSSADPALVRLDQTLNLFRDTKGSLLVFLDACRNNPFDSVGLATVGSKSVSASEAVNKSSRGFVPVGSKVDPKSLTNSLFFAYATTPDSVAYDGEGRLSPYTQAFVNLARSPGWSLDRLSAEIRNQVGEETEFQQQPWTRASLSEQIFLNGKINLEQIRNLSKKLSSEAHQALWRGNRDEAIALAIEAMPTGLPTRLLAEFDTPLNTLVPALHGPYGQIDLGGPKGGGWVSGDYDFARQRVLTYPSTERKLNHPPMQIWDLRTRKLITTADVPAVGRKIAAYFVGPDGLIVTLEQPLGGKKYKKAPLSRVAVRSAEGEFLGELPSACLKDGPLCFGDYGVAAPNEATVRYGLQSTLFRTLGCAHARIDCPTMRSRFGAAHRWADRKVSFNYNEELLALVVRHRGPSYSFLIFDIEARDFVLNEKLVGQGDFSTPHIVFSRGGNGVAAQARSTIKIFDLSRLQLAKTIVLPNDSKEPVVMLHENYNVVIFSGVKYTMLVDGKAQSFAAHDLCNGAISKRDGSVFVTVGYKHWAPYYSGASSNCVFRRTKWLSENGGRAAQIEAECERCRPNDGFRLKRTG